MKEPLVRAGFVALLAAMATGCAGPGGDAPSSPGSPIDDLVVTVGDQPFTLTNGMAEKPAAAGSAGTNVVRVVGDPVIGDITGDGKPDAALLLLNDPGGSGTFYYAAVAVRRDDAWWATNTLPLGDRITPEAITFENGLFRYRFKERRVGDAMATAPSVERTVDVRFDPKTQTISAGR